MGVPAGVALAVLCGDARGGAVGAAEHDRAAHLAARHVQRLGGGVDDLVHRLHGEVEGHELDDRPQPVHRGADRHAGEAVLGDRRVDDPLRAELVEQALADLVRRPGTARLPRRAGRRGRRHASRRPWRRAAPRARSSVRWRPSSRSATGAAAGAGGLGAGAGLAATGVFAGAWAGAAAPPLPPISAIGVLTATPSVPSGTRMLDKRAFVHRLNLHRRLVGLDLGDHVAGLHVVSHGLQPTGKLALGHGRRQSRHQDLGAHDLNPPPGCRSTIRTNPARGWPGRNRRRPARCASRRHRSS